MTDAQLHVPVSNDLIYDIGLHRGEDTDFYLKKGFRVVAIEANPRLAAEAQHRFSEYVADGRLTLVVGAVIEAGQDEATSGFVSFYENEDMPIWGTVNKTWADRNARLGHESRIIQVPVVDLKAVIAKHGMPYYMKIDIEGCDMICLRMLEKFRARPRYVSLESNKTSFEEVRIEMDVLTRLGYSHFKTIEQSSISKVQRPPLPAREGVYVDHQFDFGSSGLFGAELPGSWHSRRATVLKYALVHVGYYLLGDAGVMRSWGFPCAKLLRRITRLALRLLTRNPVPGWYDTHARNIEAVSIAVDDAERVITEGSR